MKTPESTPPMNDTKRQTLRTLTRGVYDLQKLCIEMGNRLCATLTKKLVRLFTTLAAALALVGSAGAENCYWVHY
jgi:hypothetical protein